MTAPAADCDNRHDDVAFGWRKEEALSALMTAATAESSPSAAEVAEAAEASVPWQPHFPTLQRRTKSRALLQRTAAAAAAPLLVAW
jgi:hypothetical protein